LEVGIESTRIAGGARDVVGAEDLPPDLHASVEAR
jgi:hypothetical protein